MLKHFILGFILLAQLPLSAQSFLEATGLGKDKSSLSFPEAQRAFHEWAKSHDLSKEKGWKWFKRWEAFHSQRMNPDGSLYDPAIYAREVAEISLLKSAARKQAAGGNWLPFGPSDYPATYNPNTETGLGRINCITFHPTDVNTFWVGIAQGGVWKTADGGNNWTPLTDDLPMLRISDIALDPQDPNTMYISLGDYAYLGAGLSLDDRKRHTHYGLGVYKTTDGGLNWNPTGLSLNQTDFDFSLTRRVMVDAVNSSELVAVGTHGTWKSMDAGANWSQINDSLIWDLERDPVNPEVLYASTGYRATLGVGTAGVMKSTDFGDTWTVLNTGIPGTNVVQRVELAISPSNPNVVYALCADMNAGFYGIYRSTDAGATWTLRANSPNILTWGDGSSGGGQGWYDLTILVHPTVPDMIYTGGVNAWGSDDGGQNWNGISYWRNSYGNSLHADQHFFARNPLNNRYYVCNDGGLYSTDNLTIGSWDDANNLPNYTWPTNWTKLSGGMACTSFYRLSISQNNPGYIIAGAQDNGTYYLDGPGGTWHNVYGGDGMDNILHPIDPEIFYCSSQYGNLVSSFNGGQSINWGLGSTIGEDGEWVTPYIMDPFNFATIYAAYGNVWKSTTGGNTWTALSSFPVNSGLGQPNISSALAISPSNPDYLYCAKRFYYSYGEPSAFWSTTNGGTTWNDFTGILPDSLYFTHITVDADQPATAWVCMGGFTAGNKVFKTTDAGASWLNISQNLPNLPVSTVVQDPDDGQNTIYIGMDVGVYYTNDTMTGWSIYAADLPNVIVSDLEVHRSEGKLYASTFGRGIWAVDLVRVSVGLEEELGTDFSWNVYPNPNQGTFNLEMTNWPKKQVEVEVIDVLGKVVWKKGQTIERDFVQLQVETNLQSGMYFVRLKSGPLAVSRKIFVN